jgi:hypothetical protein
MTENNVLAVKRLLCESWERKLTSALSATDLLDMERDTRSPDGRDLRVIINQATLSEAFGSPEIRVHGVNKYKSQRYLFTSALGSLCLLVTSKRTSLDKNISIILDGNPVLEHYLLYMEYKSELDGFVNFLDAVGVLKGICSGREVVKPQKNGNEFIGRLDERGNTGQAGTLFMQGTATERKNLLNVILGLDCWNVSRHAVGTKGPNEK